MEPIGTQQTHYIPTPRRALKSRTPGLKSQIWWDNEETLAPTTFIQGKWNNLSSKGMEQLYYLCSKDSKMGIWGHRPLFSWNHRLQQTHHRYPLPSVERVPYKHQPLPSQLFPHFSHIPSSIIQITIKSGTNHLRHQCLMITMRKVQVGCQPYSKPSN